MTTLDKMSEVYFLHISELALNIKQKLPIDDSDELIIQIIPTILTITGRYVPAKSPEILDEYIFNRIECLKYLKSLDCIKDYKIIDDFNHYAKKVKVKLDKTKFDDFFKELADVYQKRVVDPQLKYSEENINILSEEELEKIKMILDVIEIRLSINHPPYIMYIPFRDFPDKITRYELIGLLYKLDKDLDAIKISQITDGQKLEEQQIRIDVVEDKARFNKIKKIIDEKNKFISTKSARQTVKQAPLELKITEMPELKIQGISNQKEAENITKTNLSGNTISFDDDKAKIAIGNKECQLPAYKNEHYFCRAIWQHPVNEFVDWSTVFENMDKTLNSNKKGTEKDKRSIQDTMYAVNKRIKDVINTEDDLFTWKERSIKRNY